MLCNFLELSQCGCWVTSANSRKLLNLDKKDSSVKTMLFLYTEVLWVLGQTSSSVFMLHSFKQHCIFTKVMLTWY